MVYAREQFADLELLARVARPDAEVNVLRQGFLLLMTAFDAAVFDLVRIAFRKEFFPPPLPSHCSSSSSPHQSRIIGPQLFADFVHRYAGDHPGLVVDPFHRGTGLAGIK